MPETSKPNRDLFSVDDLSDLNIRELREQASWQGRYKVLVRWGGHLQSKDEMRTSQNLVKGCEAKVWLAHRCVDEVHQFAVDSDARIIKGLAALLMVQLNGCSRSEIESQSIEALLLDLGLAKHLSPSRANGFKALLQRSYLLVAQSPQ